MDCFPNTVGDTKHTKSNESIFGSKAFEAIMKGDFEEIQKIMLVQNDRFLPRAIAIGPFHIGSHGIGSSTSRLALLEHYETFLKLLEDAAVMEGGVGESLLYALARAEVHPSGRSLSFWQRWIYNSLCVPDSSGVFLISVCNKHIGLLWSLRRRIVSELFEFLDLKRIYEMKLAHVRFVELLNRMREVIETTSFKKQIARAEVRGAMVEAACHGTVEFITSMAKANPELFWDHEIARRVFEVAIKRRDPKIFGLIYGLPDKVAIASCVDENNNNLLHIAALVADQRVLNQIEGSVLQMQRELQWFKEVEKIVSPAAGEFKNTENLKPRDLFTKTHKNLVIEGRIWLRDMSSACTVLATLIATIAFSAASSLPIGNNQEACSPTFSNSELSKVFVISCTVSLFSSTISLLVFMGIQLSRYAEDDFVKSLPQKLIIGLSSLLLSIAAIIVTFCVGISIVYRQRFWNVFPWICLACVPVTAVSVRRQLPLLVNILSSAYGPSIFSTNAKRWI